MLNQLKALNRALRPRRTNQSNFPLEGSWGVNAVGDRVFRMAGDPPTDFVAVRISTSPDRFALAVADQSTAGSQNLEPLLGSVTETAPASDTASSGLNGRLQRVAQNVTSLIARFPAALSSAGGLKVDPVSLLAGEDQINDRIRVESRPADTDSIQETLQNAAGATGNGTAINLKGYKAWMLQVSGTFTATVTFEGTIDDSVWFPIAMVAVDSTTPGTPVLTAAGTGSAVLTGYVPQAQPYALSQFRARISAYTSGTVTVKSRKAPR